MGSEILDSAKETLKERITSPFYGKLIVAWLLWNWKIIYVTFFVNEEKIELNRVDYISNYFESNGVLYVHLIPVLITIILIWLFPYVTHEAYKAGEKFRFRKATRKKITDNKISKELIDKNLKGLQESIYIKNNEINELKLLSKYLSFESSKENSTDIGAINHYKKTWSDIDDELNKKRISRFIENYNKNLMRENFINELETKDKDFFKNNLVLDSNGDNYYLTGFGTFISKSKLFYKYTTTINGFSKFYLE